MRKIIYIPKDDFIVAAIMIFGLMLMLIGCVIVALSYNFPICINNIKNNMKAIKNLKIKIQEIKDEVDIVISHHKFLEQNKQSTV